MKHYYLIHSVYSYNAYILFFCFFFFFQAEDGIRDAQESRGLGDVYKRQVSTQSTGVGHPSTMKPSRLRLGYVYIDWLDVCFFAGFPAAIILAWILVPDKVTSGAISLFDLFNSARVLDLQDKVHEALKSAGVPPPYPSAVNFGMILFGSLVTCLGYFVSVGRRHWEHRIDIETELVDAREKVAQLEDRLHLAARDEIKKELGGKQIVRIFMDGAFDLSLIHISEPTRLLSISYAVFCLKKKKKTKE
eukprot:TRINITY_DN2361_c0_g1_i2.p1 TRINITY_DN2361_c0_g1~~TRINITY_DN2361_c0_g1_i2.p1  ORF type:complete len:247 (-),score=67.05 TRINITY_DN2361_c0_g1_i2:76-816(-)